MYSGLTDDQKVELAIAQQTNDVVALDYLPLSNVARTVALHTMSLEQMLPPPPPMQLQRRLAVMRHSVRVDMDGNADWFDKAERPYNTPISDHILPKTQAQEMARREHTFDLIVCSPFRRCLQFANSCDGARGRVYDQM